jgi:hypothetical protein
MELTGERRNELLAATREAAAAFIEDMSHIREMLDKVDPDRGEVRRLSGVLRRLLIDGGDGDLMVISPPRIGRPLFSTPDNKPLYKADKKHPFTFFGSAGVKTFGVIIRAAMVIKDPPPGPSAPEEGYDPVKSVSLPMHNFLSQNVLNLEGQWITRRDAIKFMAHIASGVHSKSPKEQIEKVIARIRQCVMYSAVPGAATLQFNIDALLPTAPPFRYEPDAIDPVLVEVLATAHFLSISPDLQRLESVIRAEQA